MPKIKDSEIIEAYRAAQQLKASDMARALGISRQALYNYQNALSGPATGIVLNWFLNGQEDWVREMAVDIFARREPFEIPCVCLEQIGDNGPCPKHAAVLVEE